MDAPGGVSLATTAGIYSMEALQVKRKAWAAQRAAHEASTAQTRQLVAAADARCVAMGLFDPPVRAAAMDTPGCRPGKKKKRKGGPVDTDELRIFDVVSFASMLGESPNIASEVLALGSMRARGLGRGVGFTRRIRAVRSALVPWQRLVSWEQMVDVASDVVERRAVASASGRR